MGLANHQGSVLFLFNPKWRLFSYARSQRNFRFDIFVNICVHWYNVTSIERDEKEKARRRVTQEGGMHRHGKVYLVKRRGLTSGGCRDVPVSKRDTSYPLSCAFQTFFLSFFFYFEDNNRDSHRASCGHRVADGTKQEKGRRCQLDRNLDQVVLKTSSAL